MSRFDPGPYIPFFGSIAQQAEHPALNREDARSKLARSTKHMPGSSVTRAPLLQGGRRRFDSAPGDQFLAEHILRFGFSEFPTGAPKLANCNACTEWTPREYADEISSMVEPTTVNRIVAGSSPVFRAKRKAVKPPMVKTRVCGSNPLLGRDTAPTAAASCRCLPTKLASAAG